MEEFIYCKIKGCNKKLKRVGNWHLKKHDMTITEYKEKFGEECMISEKTRFSLGHNRGKKRPKHSERMRGKNNPAYGGRSQETKDKISKNRKGKGKGISGKYKRTEEIRNKISAGVKKYLYNNPPKTQTAETKLKRSISLRERFRKEKKIMYHRGYHYSSKLNKKVLYRSSWEKYVMEYLDKHPNVIYWEYEPFKLPYTDEYGKSRKYTPDFLVEFDCGIKEIWEVKSSKFIDDNVRCKFEAIDVFLANNTEDISNGFVVTEDEIKMMKTYDFKEVA